ncbi:MAG TPA: hypothetical protein VKQ36_01610, partial [Ktedonobacterales bacterium]|nr:hypothetical protein [Ktedonobacterales bacterium]
MSGIDWRTYTKQRMWSKPLPRAMVSALAGAVILLLAACGALSAGPSSAASPTATPSTATSGIAGDFVGTIPDLQAGIAISSNGHNVLVYFSDGTPSRMTYALWFQGALSNNTFSLTNIATVEVTGLITTSLVTGAVTLADGSNHDFTAEPTPTGSQAGLYRSELTVNGVGYLGGWYVLDPGASATEAPLEG